MCTNVYFRTENKVVGSIGELAGMVGGFDAIVPDDADDFPPDEPISACGGQCLCPIDIEATLAPTHYILSQWEDGVDYTARKPTWLVEQEQRERDRLRYEAAMAETPAHHHLPTTSPALKPPSAEQ